MSRLTCFKVPTSPLDSAMVYMPENFFKAVSTYFSTDVQDYECLGVASLFKNLMTIMRKAAFCLCEKKCAEQLRDKCPADQHLCFH